MKLVLKNKMLMALDGMIQEGEKRGGIPKYVELSTKEAVELLKEIRYLSNERSEPLAMVSIKPSKALTNLQDNRHPIFLIKEITHSGQQDIAPQTITQFLKFWKEREIEISYNGVPLILDNATKPPPTEWTK